MYILYIDIYIYRYIVIDPDIDIYRLRLQFHII